MNSPLAGGEVPGVWKPIRRERAESSHWQVDLRGAQRQLKF